MSGLGAVDWVVGFDEDTPERSPRGDKTRRVGQEW